MSSALVAVVFDHTALLSLAAVAQRPGLADHIGVLPAIQVVELDYPAAAGMDWRRAQAVDTGRPSAEWPNGRPVITTTPEPYSGWGVEIITAR